MPSDPLWYQDAIIYEIHVRAFADSNADGIGDFPGLTDRLPYLHDLGVTCLWLLPFYPSPLRDDGYDIADYTAIHPIYGTLDDFRRFVDAAHALDIKVLTELVINHTSDQHPWFQRARQAPRGSRERDYYVWSDTDTKYAGTRIIFTDTEKSNWTFDTVAGQYYWHRFFSHQPDLNLDNPEVLEAVIDVMRFWLDLGVDAMRLDAIPYLIEREGTINENLPETHAILKHIRRVLDAQYSGRALLAEANQWPSDAQAYFGDGDECHIAFHFPLMPRMFMALRQEERHPIVEIMNQTPEIPSACQWALFLRNHDELTLEMVTDEERDYMYAQYATDPQMRVNVGIRRRLAPLMENSRPRIELMNSLLFSLPGTPILYYGDEIGMGDNVYLGDRNGVRTPMQWSSDRNAGFSRADPARLYAPVIMDSVHGYEAINVEAQERSPYSLLHWMKRMIALRKQHQVFGRGTLQFIQTWNRKVFVYVRRYEQDIVLCVANLSRTVQPAEIPLEAFAGLTPVELLGQTEFPRIGDHPYFVTLAPYGFYWFQLQETVTSVTARTAPAPDEPAALPALVSGVVWESLLDGGGRTIIERQALVPFLQRQRWFGGKARAIAGARFLDWVPLRRGLHPSFFTIVEVEYRDGGREQYAVPLAMTHGSAADAIGQEFRTNALARITGARKGLLVDGLLDDETCALLADLLQDDRAVPTRAGRLHGTPGHVPERTPPDPIAPITRNAGDQSNTSILFGKRSIMKLFRRIEPGPHPDVEVSEFLAAHGFTRVPPLAGALSYVRGEQPPAAVALLQQYIYNQGTGWHVTIEELGRYFERALTLPPRQAHEGETVWTLETGAPPDDVAEAIGAYLTIAEVLGRRTGELHAHLAGAAGEPAFAPEPYTADDVGATTAAMRRHAEDRLSLLGASLDRLDDRRRELAAAVLARREDVVRLLDEGRDLHGAGRRIRCHGDYHLGQVLVTEGDVMIIDFEGEPARPLAERRNKCSPLRDVAGMLRSFGYAALTALGAATLTRPADVERLAPWADLWERWVSGRFLRAYVAAARDSRILPPRVDDLERLLMVFLVDKACYELGYELNNRPDWVHVPLAGLLRLSSTGKPLTQISR
ncbi:MAG: maltose alpha-D-glucosyltransferase [Acidobacteria bacterium RIFCSPLOWO2_12_FULL_67_14]|nr:MAG: maltose alpha-D-glucosyltransferase [Acidobacteria bacterium RIFCSPLOWO2_02_FULL_67_21]OFW34780.1 MAG: maltose alpha-D-glucosyltransferase [Acidobacteria bacterium RIFCSPLOWO2_12_FULL_67_14]